MVCVVPVSWTVRCDLINCDLLCCSVVWIVNKVELMIWWLLFRPDMTLYNLMASVSLIRSHVRSQCRSPFAPDWELAFNNPQSLHGWALSGMGPAAQTNQIKRVISRVIDPLTLRVARADLRCFARLSSHLRHVNIKHVLPVMSRPTFLIHSISSSIIVSA